MGEIFANDGTNKGVNVKIVNSSITKNKKFNQKMGRRPKQTFSKRRYTNSQQVHENMFNTVNC